MNATQIGKIVGRDPKSVWTWLKHAGIKTRARGFGVPSQLFTKGMKNHMKGRSHSVQSRLKISQSNMGKPKIPNGEKHHWAGVIGSLHPSWKGGLTPERQSFYGSKEWKAACVAVWHRADAKCERCGLDSRSIPTKDRNFHIHHIVSFQVRKLRAEVTNLMLACAPCHKFIHSKLNVNNEFIKRVKP